MAFVSHQMSAPLQRRAPSRLPPLHGARIAETLHQLRRCAALPGANGEPSPAGCEEESSTTCSGFQRFLLWRRNRLSDSPDLGGSYLPLPKCSVMTKEAVPAGTQCNVFACPKNKPERIRFTQPGLLYRGTWSTPAAPAHAASRGVLDTEHRLVGMGTGPVFRWQSNKKFVF